MFESDGWFSSSFSNKECVQVKLCERVFVRDSKDPFGPVLSFTDREWIAFLEGARNGEFDLLWHPPKKADGAH